MVGLGTVLDSAAPGAAWELSVEPSMPRITNVLIMREAPNARSGLSFIDNFVFRGLWIGLL
jgi:hypothetical protein